LEGTKTIDSTKQVKVIPTEKEAIDYALKNAKKGSFIVICSDVVPNALEQVMKFKEDEDSFQLQPGDIQATSGE
jgi:cyanophycin synthetase